MVHRIVRSITHKWRSSKSTGSTNIRFHKSQSSREIRMLVGSHRWFTADAFCVYIFCYAVHHASNGCCRRFERKWRLHMWKQQSKLPTSCWSIFNKYFSILKSWRTILSVLEHHISRSTWSMNIFAPNLESTFQWHTKLYGNQWKWDWYWPRQGDHLKITFQKKNSVQRFNQVRWLCIFIVCRET